MVTVAEFEQIWRETAPSALRIVTERLARSAWTRRLDMDFKDVAEEALAQAGEYLSKRLPMMPRLTPSYVIQLTVSRALNIQRQRRRERKNIGAYQKGTMQDLANAIDQEPEDES